MEPKIVLFMGDSITDAGRNWEGGVHLGYGYPTMVAGRLGVREPFVYRCFNRGISGNRVVDLYARIKADMINLKPDYMSILIGINDVWHEIASKNGVDAEKFEMVYDMLIRELHSALPNLKLMLLEPFVLPGSDTCSNEANPGRWETFRSETELRAAAVKRLAAKHALKFVPLQERFDRANEGAPMGYWLRDGVHPTAAGHALITEAWLEAFREIQ